MKALSFKGSGSEYFKIWIVNILLTIITLGLYYPWAKVRNNRYFYGNSELEGRNFEYHATGKQLFIGFLISMFLLILYIGIQAISPAGSLIVVVLLFLALPWIIWRSLQFNMRMTSFSNVRFSFNAGLGQAYLNYLLIPIGLLLVVYGIPALIAYFGTPVLTELMDVTPDGSMSPEMILAMVIFSILFFALVILAIAFLKKRNTNYALNGIRFGQGQFSTDVKTGKFALISFKTLGLGLLLMTLLTIGLGVVAMLLGFGDEFLELASNIEDPEATEEILTEGMFASIGAMYLGFIIISMIVFSYFYSRQREYIFDNTKLDNKISFASTLKALPLTWVTISNFLMVIVTLGFALPWAKVRMARLILENTVVDTTVGFDEYVTQQHDQQSALGEQLGDAFDVDIGIGI